LLLFKIAAYYLLYLTPNAAILSFYAVIHENEKRMPRTLLYKSYGMQMLCSHTFVSGDIGLGRKNLKNLKQPKNL